MKVWTVINGKGGVGKTTLVTNLASIAARNGERVVVLDLDPQLSAKKWWSRGEVDNPIISSCQPNELEGKIKRIREAGITLLLLDTAGRTSSAYEKAISEANLCIIPVQPSPADLDVLSDVVMNVRSLQPNYLFVASRCPTAGKDFEQLKSVLETYGLVSDVCMRERKAYKWAYGQGKDVCSLAESEPVKRDREAIEKAVVEISGIYNWILQKEKRFEDVY